MQRRLVDFCQSAGEMKKGDSLQQREQLRDPVKTCHGRLDKAGHCMPAKLHERKHFIFCEQGGKGRRGGSNSSPDTISQKATEAVPTQENNHINDVLLISPDRDVFPAGSSGPTTPSVWPLCVQQRPQTAPGSRPTLSEACTVAASTRHTAPGGTTAQVMCRSSGDRQQPVQCCRTSSRAVQR